VRCPEYGVRQVSVPWARPGSGFTLLFEALALSFAAAMPMAKVAGMTREHGTQLWRVVEHHVHATRDQLDSSGVRRVGVDETSARKGQDYVSIFADLDARRVLFATEDRSADTVARFAADLAEHGGDPAKVTDTSSDMSTAFISGIGAAKLSEAIDAVRREVKTRPELRRTRWLWLRNWSNLSAQQQGELHRLMRPRSSSRPPGHCAGGKTSRPFTTRIPATRPSICGVGIPGRNAPTRSRSRTSWPLWRITGTASWPGTPTT